MRVIKQSTLFTWGRDHPAATEPLRHWLKVVKVARWSDLQSVRRDFPHADPVKVGSGNTVTVFNIGGGNFRLITAIKYRSGVVYVLRFLTHAEYSRGISRRTGSPGRWKDTL